MSNGINGIITKIKAQKNQNTKTITFEILL